MKTNMHWQEKDVIPSKQDVRLGVILSSIGIGMLIVAPIIMLWLFLFGR